MARMIPYAASILLLGACFTQERSADAVVDQESIVQRGLNQCDGCALSLQREVVLGDAEGPGTIESKTTLASRDSKGRYYVREEYGATIKVFDAAGTYLTTIGRRGAGPGEFEMIAAVEHTTGDTLHVFDTRNLRRSVLSPDFGFVRSNPLAIRPANQVILTPNGGAVFGTTIRTAELIGFPLHLLDASGDRVRSFGSVTGEFDAAVPYSDERVLAKADDGAVWATYRTRYALELWSVDGVSEPIRVLERKVPWFPPHARQPQSASDAPPPRLQAIRLVDNDRMLVVILVAGKTWQKAVRDGGIHPIVTDWQGYYDSIIELIDLSSGEVLASAKSPLAFHDFVDDELLSTVTFDDAHNPYLEVWRVRFQQ
jgi:hypothetical protein